MGKLHRKKSGVEKYLRAAERGNADAQLKLGDIYSSSSGDSLPDYELALKWYTLAAERGKVEAYIELGKMYSNGHGVPKDNKVANEYYSTAVQKSKTPVSMEYNIGYMYYHGNGVAKDYDMALRWFGLAEKHDHVVAASDMGDIHANGGHGVPKNIALAEKWHKIAIDRMPVGVAKNVFAKNYFSNYCGYADYPTVAFNWFRNAAKEDDQCSQFELGLLYEKGIGVARNYQLAAKWYRIAIDGRKPGKSQYYHAEAGYRLGLLHYMGWGVAKDHDFAYKCYSRAAEHNLLIAKISLARMHKYGRGTRKDKDMAAKWLANAMWQRDTEMSEVLGLTHFASDQDDVDIDELEFAECKLAAMKGNAGEMYRLATMYYRGSGVKRNRKMAIEHISLAAEKGNATANCAMGFLYSKGLVLPKDFGLADKCYNSAAELDCDDAKYSLAIMNHYGIVGAGADDVLACMWAILGEPGSGDFREYLEAHMKAREKLQAKKIAGQFKYKNLLVLH